MKQTHSPVIRDFNDPPPDPRLGQRFGILERPTGNVTSWQEDTCDTMMPGPVDMLVGVGAMRSLGGLISGSIKKGMDRLPRNGLRKVR